MNAFSSSLKGSWFLNEYVTEQPISTEPQVEPVLQFKNRVLAWNWEIIRKEIIL